MVKDRLIDPQDKVLLAVSIAKDEHHKGTMTPDFFYTPGTVSKVYEDEQSPVCFVRFSKVLRLDIQYVNNYDKRRNLETMISGFGAAEKLARDNGYTEIEFQSNSDLLKKFCTKRFGFVEEDGGIMRKLL